MDVRRFGLPKGEAVQRTQPNVPTQRRGPWQAHCRYVLMKEVMMRAILLPMVEPEVDRMAVQVSLGLAGMLDGHVTALLPLTDFASLPVAGHYPDFAGWGELVAHTHEHAERRETEVRQVLDELGVLPSAAARATEADDRRLTFRAIIGNSDHVLADCALTHDLILFARRASAQEPSLPTSWLMKSTLETAGRPILVVTDDVPTAFPRVVAIAWNGSVEAAHAVTAALPLLARAERVHVLTFATQRTPGKKAEDLVEYLSRHGIAAEAQVREPELSVGRELLAAVDTLSADLIVMGGYTHSRIRQTLFGGVTHHVLENARVPLLLAR